MSDGKPFQSFEILAPARWSAPVIFNSPHSGRNYSQEFLSMSRLPISSLRKSEDCFVDELFSGCIGHGAPLLRALAPRSFVDLNREPWELDPRMFSDQLPGYANVTSPRVAGGLGTIPRVVAEGEEIYRTRLKFAEALRRIERVYLPYHRTLSALVDEACRTTGHVLLIDCHSMPASAASHLAAPFAGAVDAVIGDRFGASCGEPVSDALESLLRSHGLKVFRNKPYAGGFITQNHGSPGRGRHAVQLELSRGLYMKEETFEKTSGFAALKGMLDDVMGRLVRDIALLLEPNRQAAE